MWQTPSNPPLAKSHRLAYSLARSKNVLVGFSRGEYRMSWSSYQLEIKAGLDQAEVSAFMALLASLCNERSERPKEDASFSYDSASGDLFFSTQNILGTARFPARR